MTVWNDSTVQVSAAYKSPAWSSDFFDVEWVKLVPASLRRIWVHLDDHVQQFLAHQANIEGHKRVCGTETVDEIDRRADGELVLHSFGLHYYSSRGVR